MPRLDPKAKIVSYSGPSPFSVEVCVSRLQPIGQLQQALRLVRNSSRRRSPEIASAPSNSPCWKLRVGSTPYQFIKLTSTEVPNSGKPCEVRGEAEIILRASYSTKSRASFSATPGRCCPPARIAFRFFDPITAPTPPRP